MKHVDSTTQTVNAAITTAWRGFAAVKLDCTPAGGVRTGVSPEEFMAFPVMFNHGTIEESTVVKKLMKRGLLESNKKQILVVIVESWELVGLRASACSYELS